MYISKIFLGLSLAVQVSAQESICDKYTTALFKDNNEENQLKLLTALVNTVVIGNYTPTANGRTVPGILVETEFNGGRVNMLPKFIGKSGPTTNVDGKPTEGINFLDGGGAEALKQNKPSLQPGTRQELLLNHLYGVFGSITGCSKQGGSIFPNYSGKESMTEVHKFMDISKPTMDYFINQVGEAALSFGVSNSDAQIVGSALNALFNNKCTWPIRLTPKSNPEPQGFCLGEGCTSDCINDSRNGRSGTTSNDGSGNNRAGTTDTTIPARQVKCRRRQ